MKFVPHDYQKRAIKKILTTPFVGLFLEMGLGKSVISLTAAMTLMYEELDVDRVLVIAPLKVAEDTWSRECAKWDHLQELKVSKIIGSRQKREAAVEAEADIYVVNRENVSWLVSNYYGRWKWDMLIVDELSSFKNPQAERFKALKKVRPKFRRIVGLTGTPDPNGLMDLWAEMYVIDGGKRLERTIGRYRQLYFKPGRVNGYVVYNWIAREGSEQLITERISDITVAMKAADYLTLPKRIDNDITVHLSPKAAKTYKELERDHVLALDDTEITAANAAAVMGKLLQLSGGAIYDDLGDPIVFHDEKLKALRDIVDTANEPVLVFYGFRHERTRLFEMLKAYGPRELGSEDDIREWNEGKIKVLLAHPASVGYGLNLQDGGRIIVWYSIPWNLELYQQANARLYRQGQTKPVIINRLVAEGTVDERVIQSLNNKDMTQAALMTALKERRDQYELRK